MGMGISFKLSKVGVRVHPAARSASTAPAEKPVAVEAEGSVSDSRREVRRSVLSVSRGLAFLSHREMPSVATAGVGIWTRKDGSFACGTDEKPSFCLGFDVLRRRVFIYLQEG